MSPEVPASPQNPEAVGPYRLVAKLGQGGMGAVYRATDERLGRQVAIKRIRAEAASDPSLRARFRREARAAARLSHPAIVQIHDVVFEPSGDWIVMELVPGESLAEQLRSGPAPPRQVLSWLEQVAEGLSAAHAAGIVHRDLKSENIMLSPDGRARILDFGLAKQVPGGGGAPSGEGASSDAFSVEGQLVGTLRSMSPEQALGRPVDGRSDLFSLGVLAYECLTGSSPFLGASQVETLTRICSQPHASARSLRPGLSKPLADLVDRLLEKEPERRPRSAEEVVVTLRELRVSEGEEGGPSVGGPGMESTLWPAGSPSPAAVGGRRKARRRFWPIALGLFLGLGLLGFWRLLGPAKAPLYVAVTMPIEEESAAEGEARLLASDLRAALVGGLLERQGLAVLAGEEVDLAADSAQSLAQAVAADELLVARLLCRPEVCQVVLERQGAEALLLASASFDLPPEDPFLMATGVRAHLRDLYPGFKSAGAAGRGFENEVSPQDYAAFLDLRRQAFARELDLEEVLEGLEGLLRTSPSFLGGHLLAARTARLLHAETRVAGDLERALGFARRARELAPRQIEPLLQLFNAALQGGEGDTAAEALRAMQSLAPADSRVGVCKALHLRSEGKQEEALREMRRAVLRRPAWNALVDLANMELAAGEVAAARGSLEQALAVFPESYRGRSLLAQLELSSGDPRRAAELYEALVRRTPTLIDLSNLGLARLLLDDFPGAVESLALAREQAPANPFVLLNLADALLLSGRRGEAEGLYGEVLRLLTPAEGHPEGSGPMERSSSWQARSVEAQALAHLGRVEEAVAAIQEALRLAPGHPQVAYEAAVVYALLGERASALGRAREALAGGVEPRWLTLPWFAEVPGLAELLP